MKTKSRYILSRIEMYKLIDLWTEYIDQLRGKYRNKDVYKTMSVELRKRYRMTLSCGEIRNRINNLKKRFKIEKRNELSGRGASTWPYFQQLQQILIDDNTSRLEQSYAHEEDADGINPSILHDSPIPEPSVNLKEEEDVNNDSIETTHQGKWYEEEFLRIAKEEQQNMQKYFKQSLENDKKIIQLLQNNNDLLSQLLNKTQKLDT